MSMFLLALISLCYMFEVAYFTYFTHSPGPPSVFIIVETCQNPGNNSRF